jgi:transposase
LLNSASAPGEGPGGQGGCFFEGGAAKVGKFNLAIMDKAYDTNEIRAFLTDVGAVACIPSRANRKQPIPLDAFNYHSRHKVENFFEKIKRTRRTATRYNKTDSPFLAFLLLSMTCLFLRGQF